MQQRKTLGKAAFVLAIANGKSVNEAAFDAGIGERQAYCWLQRSDITEQIKITQSELISRAVKSLAGTASQAVETLTDLLNDEASNIRLQAARAILSHLIDLNKSDRRETRIDELEKQIIRK